MAGSIKWFVYTDDGSNDYAIKLDESNTEAINGSGQDYLPDATLNAGVPRNIKPRSVVYSNLLRTRNIRCIALTQAVYQGVLNGNIPTIPDPISPGQNLFLTRLDGEKRVLPFGQDTGLDDGDQT